MKPGYFLVILSFLTSTIVLGQVSSKHSYFGVRAGYLRASTNITSSPEGSSLRGLAPLNSFYGGVFYQHTLPSRIAYRVELNYQQKGNEAQDQNGTVAYQRKFQYVGLTPLIGITPISGLSLLVGPEVNFYFGKKAFDRNAPLAEFGISGRVVYRHKWIGIEAGYFKGINEYNSITIKNSPIIGGDTRFNFRNQTWQVGLIFVPTMLKTGKSVN